jgi:hypothetical protein
MAKLSKTKAPLSQCFTVLGINISAATSLGKADISSVSGIICRKANIIEKTSFQRTRFFHGLTPQKYKQL